MRIAIDASRAINEKAGVGRYTRELIKKLIEIDQKNQYLLLFTFWRASRTKMKLIKEFRRPNVQIKTLKIPGSLKEKIWDWPMPWFKSFLGEVDLFYAPSFFEVNFGLKIPQVVTIYDLATNLFPEHRGKEVSKKLNKRAAKACRMAQKIIAISESTKNDLKKHLKIPEAKIEVVYPGRNELSEPAKHLPFSLKNGTYILFVGTIEPRKNLIGLFKAYSLLPLKLQEKYPLVVSGAEGWNIGETFEMFESLKLAGKVKFLGFVSDSVLAKLYKEATVFCYPSLYEGFGFPVLEALSFGAPVVTSNVSSLPEVTGKAAVLVDPGEPKAIASAIERLLEHQKERSDLQMLGPRRAKKFSWERTAKQTLKLFKEIGNKK